MEEKEKITQNPGAPGAPETPQAPQAPTEPSGTPLEISKPEGAPPEGVLPAPSGVEPTALGGEMPPILEGLKKEPDLEVEKTEPTIPPKTKEGDLSRPPEAHSLEESIRSRQEGEPSKS